jgi:hypothetical protein
VNRLHATFESWLDTFIEEKGGHPDHFEFEDSGGTYHYMPFGVLVEAMKGASPEEKSGIKNMIVKIDFHNGNVWDFFEHLAKGLAEGAS